MQRCVVGRDRDTGMGGGLQPAPITLELGPQGIIETILKKTNISMITSLPASEQQPAKYK